MNKELTSRSKNVMTYIEKNHECTLRDIAEKLNLSLRQVRYDIQCINNYFNKILILTDNKGKILIDDIDDFRFFNSEITYSKSERHDYIMVLIAFDMQTFNINQIAQKLNKSRVTIKNDLDEIKKILTDKYGLSLKYYHKYILEGTEEDIFRLRIDGLKILKKYYQSHSDDEWHIYNHLDYIHILLTYMDQMESILRKFMEKYQLHSNDAQFWYIANRLTIMIWYKKHKKSIPRNLIEGEHNILSLEINFNDLYYELEKYFCIQLDSNLKEHIVKVISIFFINFNQNEANMIERVVIYIYEFIKYIQDNCHIKLYNDKNLFLGLFQHLIIYCKKGCIDLDLTIFKTYEIPLDDEIKKCINDFCLSHTDTIQIHTFQEIAFLQLYIVNSIRKKTEYNKKKVVLVSGASFYHKKALIKDLESIYEVNVVDCCSLHEMLFIKKYEKIDFYLFTEEIPHQLDGRKDILKINIVLNKDDLHHLDCCGFDIKRYTFDLEEIKSELLFLDTIERFKVLNVIENYIHRKTKYINLETLNHLSISDIRIVDKVRFYPKRELKIAEKLILSFQYHFKNEIEIDICEKEDNMIIMLKSNGIAELISCMLLLEDMAKNNLLHPQTLYQDLLELSCYLKLV